jgi:serine/threonine-protein kinase
VAIKTLDSPLAEGNEKLRARFLHEAKLLALVQHPSIPYVITNGTSGQTPYIVMQFVEGESIRQKLLRGGKIEPTAALAIARAVLSALAHAHAQNVVHRDVKPENILVNRDGHAYLIDFSIGATLEDTRGLTRVTGGDNTPGTQAYMAPEVLRREPWNHRIDVYAAGIVLYEMLVGRPLTLETLERDLQALSDANTAKAVKKACSASPDARFESAAAFEKALQRLAVQSKEGGASITAICGNQDCRAAEWTPTFQPAVFKATADRYCKTCGNELLSGCEKCGRRLDDGSQFCADCGNKHYEIPSCRQCGAPLAMNERNRATEIDGCSQCEIPF